MQQLRNKRKINDKFMYIFINFLNLSYIKYKDPKIIATR